MKLKDKVALVTGSSKGIGEAIARKFASEGANIIIAYNKNRQLALSLEGELVRLSSTSHLPVRLDVSSLDSIKEAVKYALDEFGRIDILVNNAATYYRNRFEDATEEIWEETFNTNVRGPYFLTKEISKHMLERKSGNIINITSDIAAGVKIGTGLEYGASKACLDYLTRSLAATLAPTIRVNAIAPGYTISDMSNLANDPDKLEKANNDNPLGRVNVPEDVAQTALFLASDDSRNISGETIYLNGGKHL